MMNRIKVGILSAFTGSDEAFSLVVVVKTQLQMLLAGGYQPVLFVADPFNAGSDFWAGRQFQVRKLANPDAPTETVLAAMRTQITDIDVMLCHDIVFLAQHHAWAEALRKFAAERPHIAWLHWQHSRGGHSPIEPIERSWFCYPNQGDLPHVAQINSTTPDQVRYIPHPLDLAYLGWPDLAVRIAEDTGYPFADVSGVLPARLDRQKQVEKAVRVFAGIKRAGRSVCFLIADAYATGEHFKQYKREVAVIAKEQGLTDKEFAFLGETYEECTYATPRQVVKALYEMGNLFIQPSNAETSSLIAMEAALAGNLLVLNRDFPPILSLYAKAITLPFCSIFEDTKYYRHIPTADGGQTKVDDPQLFFDDQARLTILPALDSQIALTVKRQQLRERWPSKVFTEFIEPLILEAWAEVKPAAIYAPVGDPDVTAIITTMDNLPILEQQVEILLSECGRVIVVNNGSLDGTADWLALQDRPGLEYINRENKGAGPGRNAGLDLWDSSTPYVLMVDGGILPPIGGVRELRAYLERHPEADVISPEVASCFTTDLDAATRIAPPLPDPLETFWQRCLSSTAYCLTRARVWDVRFCEDGPYAEPGWGVDDNFMAYEWDDHEPPIMHREFTHSASGWLLYRRGSGSFQRLFAETGVWPNQYGSVYERRNVKCQQDWRKYHAMLYGRAAVPSISYVIDGVSMPDFARLVKHLHDQDANCEVICPEGQSPEVARWLDTFALRWPWGNLTFDPDGNKLHRGIEYPEELWSGDVVRNRGPLSENVITITPANLGEFYVAAAA